MTYFCYDQSELITIKLTGLVWSLHLGEWDNVVLNVANTV